MFYSWDKNKTFIIWGIGHVGQELFDRMIINNYSIKYFVDNDKKKYNKIYKGKLVDDPKKILSEDTKKSVHIIIASRYHEEIAKQLNDFGLIEGIDYSIWKGYLKYGELSGVIKGVPKEYIVNKSRDGVGNVVFDLENKRVYRVIRDHKIVKTKNILDKCIENNLFEKYLISTKICDDKNIINRELVLEHEYVNNITYPSEWISEMIKYAGIFYLEFLLRLNEIGLVLRDADNYNISFKDGNFIWLDFASINDGELTVQTIYQFINNFINTIILFDKEEGQEKVLCSYPNELCYKDIEGYMSESERNEYKKNIIRVNSYVKNGYIIKKDIPILIEILKQWINSINYLTLTSHWDYYQDEILDNVRKIDKWDKKYKIIIDMIDKIEYNTVLDIAGNAGFLCFVLADKNKNCILADLDRNAIRKGYFKIKVENNKKITPVIFNFKPKYIQSKLRLEEERFKSDLVLAIAIVHHLVFLEKLTFEEIINRLYAFSGTYLLVEFTYPEEKSVSEWMNDDFKWYNHENFEEHIKNKFKIISKKNYAEDRILLLCVKL